MNRDTQFEALREGRPASGPRPNLSIVVPVYNEEDNLEVLYERLTAVLGEYGRTYELVFIDDGSKDGSYHILEGLHARDPAVRVVRFIRNFGQQMAISAGFQYATGEVIVLIDADLQVPPEEIPRLAERLGEGYDIVYGVRAKRKGSLVRRAGSWVMSHLLYRITGIDIPDSASGFIAIDRRLVESVNLFNERSKYFSGLFAWLSYGRHAAIDVSHSERHAGESKYTIMKLVALTLNFVCNFTTAPLRIPFILGAATALCGLVLLAWLAGCAMAGWVPAHAPFWVLAAVVALFSGVQLLCLGIVGEYLGRVHREVREQPNFVVRDLLWRDALPREDPSETGADGTAN